MFTFRQMFRKSNFFGGLRVPIIGWPNFFLFCLCRTVITRDRLFEARLALTADKSKIPNNSMYSLNN